MSIHQLSVLYIDEQDRLLVRANNAADEEFRFWLTRRMAQGFWPLLQKLLRHHVAAAEGGALAGSDDLSRQLMSDFQRERVLGEVDFRTPYRNEAVQLPLGPEPLLVTDIQMTPQEQGCVLFLLTEKLQGASPDAPPRSFRMTLTPALMHGWVHLLTQALEVSLWAQAVPGLPAATQAEAEELALPVNVPGKYLN